MFKFAYDAYVKHAYPHDELRPISCTGKDTWGSYSLTLIDALDTLLVMGEWERARDAIRRLSDTLSFDRDNNVSVFESNIRVLGCDPLVQLWLTAAG
jgi:mannosidase alpha-like ER degradation enhancer 2